jgi:hypothetical protein
MGRASFDRANAGSCGLRTNPVLIVMNNRVSKHLVTIFIQSRYAVNSEENQTLLRLHSFQKSLEAEPGVSLPTQFPAIDREKRLDAISRDESQKDPLCHPRCIDHRHELGP